MFAVHKLIIKLYFITSLGKTVISKPILYQIFLLYETTFT